MQPSRLRLSKNKSRERRGEEWSREEKTGKVRSLDKLWFKSKKKKKLEKKLETIRRKRQEQKE